MAIVIKPITVEVSKPNVFQAIAAKQNDCNSRFLNVTFVNEGEKIPVLTTSKVTINAKRNDGMSDSFFGEVNEDGTATLPIHSWILELAGYVDCDVTIIDSEGRALTCTKFSLLVEEASNSSSDVTESEQYNVLSDLIEEVSALKSGTSGMFADAIKNTLSGNIVKAKDVSPIEHELDVSVNNLVFDNMSYYVIPWNTEDPTYYEEVPPSEIGFELIVSDSKKFIDKTTEQGVVYGSDPVWFKLCCYNEYYSADLYYSYDRKDWINIFNGWNQWYSEEEIYNNYGISFAGRDQEWCEWVEFTVTSGIPKTVQTSIIDMDEYTYSNYEEGHPTEEWLSIDNLDTFVSAVRSEYFEKNGLTWEDGTTHEFKIEWWSDDSNELFIHSGNDWIYFDRDVYEYASETWKPKYGMWFNAWSSGDYCIIRVTPNVVCTPCLLVNKTEYPINDDGTVNGVMSEAPDMTIKVNHFEEATVDVTYNLDTKKYIDNKFAELKTMITNLQ